MRRVWIFRILTLLYIIAVAVLCFARFSALPPSPASIFGIPADKVVHFLMFLPFPVLAFFSLRLSRGGVVKTLLVLVAVFIVGCGLAWGTEYIQSKLPYRTMDPADFGADRLGLICGSFIAFFIKLFSRKKKNA
ncbi:MAG: VanZ family protein [Bacteroidales bacterium]|nr:VanZ family protein [Bacteroidales bacterium]MBP5521167.1 VanZ family protein [Bacteroidales bacterium]